jgi:hypothetical protein
VVAGTGFSPFGSKDRTTLTWINEWTHNCLGSHDPKSLLPATPSKTNMPFRVIDVGKRDSASDYIELRETLNFESPSPYVTLS